MKKYLFYKPTRIRLMNQAIRLLSNVGFGLFAILRFLCTLSSKMNQRYVRKYPLFFRIHDYLILGAGIASVILIFAGCSIIDNSTTTGFLTLIMEGLPYSGTGFVICGALAFFNNDKFWNR